jgi:hypothetical protein
MGIEYLVDFEFTKLPTSFKSANHDTGKVNQQKAARLNFVLE